MGKIYFTEGLFESVLQIIKESHDCVDAANDLEMIQNTIHHGTDMEAASLDAHLRRKYPVITTMLNIADFMQAQPCSESSGVVLQSPYKSKLEQDYWGILCQTAIKKGIKTDLESCIDHVEQ